MYYKRSITFRIKTNKNVVGDQKLVIRATWCGQRLEFATPHSISPQQWDKNKQIAKGRTNSSGVPVSLINSDLDTLRGYMTDVFNRYEFIDKRPPTPDEVKLLYNDLTGKETIDEIASEVFISLLDGYDKFLDANYNKWTKGTYKHYITLKNHLEDFGDAPLDSVDDTYIQKLQNYLSNEANIRNTTNQRLMSRIKTVLRWLSKHGYYSGKSHVTFSTKLKGTNVKEVIVLTPDELTTLYNLTFTESQKHLERVRDILLFGCYTGLRYSDIQGLTKADIRDNCIKLVTVKTADAITIELNKVAKSIIDKYKDYSDTKLLPTISNQKANNYLKELGKLAGIDAPTVITYYNSEGRNSEVKPKYEMMTTHIARRTFISNALAMGIPSSIVMSWSGHKDFKAMRPYIKMIDKQKKQAMSKFDDLIK